ncbi:MAG: transketolase family protein [Burkholderiaceae bacterium]
MRNAFVEELVNAARKGKNVALVVGDLGYKVIEPFADEFPHLFLNAGIAEQNMMGLAAGLASEGVHVFVYSIGNFPTFRCAEQVRNDVDYHKLPVTIVSVGGGLAYGNLGYSHHAVQDYALIRSMPNMMIAAPGDPMEVRGCFRYLIDNPCPSYFRLGKAGEQNFHDVVPIIDPGKWLSIRTDNKDFSKSTILSTGTALELARKLVTSDAYEGYSLHTLPMWGMNTKYLQPEICASWKKIVTVEDHLIDGGFGSWLVEALQNTNYNLNRVSIRSLDKKVCGMVGKQSTLNYAGGFV